MNIDEPGLTGQILGAAFEVSNTLGAGFLEKVYARALLQELKLRGIGAVAEASFRVIYKGQCIGEYFADILVENAVVIELKCVDRLASEKMACPSARAQKPPSSASRTSKISSIPIEYRAACACSCSKRATKRGDRRLTEEIHVLGYYI